MENVELEWKYTRCWYFLLKLMKFWWWYFLMLKSNWDSADLVIFHDNDEIKKKFDIFYTKCWNPMKIWLFFILQLKIHKIKWKYIWKCFSNQMGIKLIELGFIFSYENIEIKWKYCRFRYFLVEMLNYMWFFFQI